MAFKKIGSLWKKKSETTGKTYLSGVVTVDGVEAKITIWQNDKGGVEKRPDYVIQMKVEDEPTPPAPEPDDEDQPF